MHAVFQIKNRMAVAGPWACNNDQELNSLRERLGGHYEMGGEMLTLELYSRVEFEELCRLNKPIPVENLEEWEPLG
jgi:hypothetical protein